MIESQLRHLLNEPELRCQLSENFGATMADGRAQLREAILKQLNEINGSLSEDQKAIGRDLSQPLTRLHDRCISISHTKGLGGFLIAPRPCGFDVELSSRVNEKAVARISRPHEMAQAPSPAHLWTAKEAAYKAFGTFEDVALLSQIEIMDWSTLDTDSRSGIFRAKNLSDFLAPAGLGCVIEHEVFLIAAFLFIP